MRKRNVLIRLGAWLLIIGAIGAHYKFDPWGFYRKVSPEETASRIRLVTVAQTHLGRNEADGSHQAILDRYNTQEGGQLVCNLRHRRFHGSRSGRSHPAGVRL